MFWVINKEKVYAYMVSIFTIVSLFFMSGVLNSNLGETKETSGKISENINTENNIVSNNSMMQENVID